ncbi:MAG: bifunctional hydroxymethylpyrimidine kinase/phosphomethylpyrimidine kinase [Chloroflexi bacterium]|nr:bifunctional hydroxymethylpyrimidine kinase/phosphomethylpyrimidine kinase [Chloroflexota bacterium]
MAVRRALTIAGSDSGGGAGIQADLKTFSALGVYGASVLTAITAQNTIGVTGIHEIPREMIEAQIDAVLADIGADAVKTGMIASSEIIDAVAERVQRHGVTRLVVDPVMVAKSGDSLLHPSAVETLRRRLIPLAAVVTPNLPEAETLTGRAIATLAEMRDAAQAIADLGARAVVVKGGHLAGPAIDVLFDGQHFHELSAERVQTRNTHGTGCTFASAIAAFLARGETVPLAVAQAKEYLTGAIRNAYDVGAGHGPVHHFWRWWSA